jgi:hypothetical protein
LGSVSNGDKDKRLANAVVAHKNNFDRFGFEERVMRAARRRGEHEAATFDWPDGSWKKDNRERYRQRYKKIKFDTWQHATGCVLWWRSPHKMKTYVRNWDGADQYQDCETVLFSPPKGAIWQSDEKTKSKYPFSGHTSWR